MDRFTYVALPFLGKCEATVNISRVEVGLGWQAWLIKSLIPRNLGDLLLDFRIAVCLKEVQESLLEFKRIKGLVGPRFKVVWDELVEVFSAY